MHHISGWTKIANKTDGTFGGQPLRGLKDELKILIWAECGCRTPFGINQKYVLSILPIGWIYNAPSCQISAKHPIRCWVFDDLWYIFIRNECRELYRKREIKENNKRLAHNKFPHLCCFSPKFSVTTCTGIWITVKWSVLLVFWQVFGAQYHRSLKFLYYHQNWSALQCSFSVTAELLVISCSVKTFLLHFEENCQKNKPFVLNVIWSCRPNSEDPCYHWAFR